MRSTPALILTILLLASTAVAADPPCPPDEATESPAVEQTAAPAYRIFVDPKTGHIREPEPGETARAAARLESLFKQSVDDLEMTIRADGTKMIEHVGRFMNFAVLRRNPDGSFSMECVNTPAAAAAVLHQETLPRKTERAEE